MTPEILLDKLQPIPKELHIELFNCLDIPLDIHFQFLKGDISSICSILESEDLMLLKR